MHSIKELLHEQRKFFAPEIEDRMPCRSRRDGSTGPVLTGRDRLKPDSKTSASFNTFLREAIENGDLHKIRALLKQGNSVNALPINKEIPLHAVVRSSGFSGDQEKIEAIKLLIRAGADGDAKDIYHLTALDHAIHLNNMPLACAILSEKIGIASEKIQTQLELTHSLANVKERMHQKSVIDPATLDPLEKAAYEGNLDTLNKAASAQHSAPIEELSPKRGEILRSGDGRQILCRRLSDSPLDPVLKNRTQAELPVQFRIDRLDQYGLAPIHYAILGNKAASFQSLLKLGADPKVLTSNKDSILHLAAIKKSPELLKLALECKVDINHQNAQGETALHYAFLQEDWTGIRTLVQKGADASITDLCGISPPAGFISLSLQKDPLLVSSKDVAETIFGTLFLWQLGSRNLETLSNFRSWPSLFTASFLGLLGMQAIPQGDHKTLSAMTSIAKEFIPGFGLGWSAKRTYQSLSPSLQMVKRGWEYLGYRNRNALQNIALGSIGAIAKLALLSTQAALQLGMVLPDTDAKKNLPSLALRNPSQNPASLKNPATSRAAAIVAQREQNPEEITQILKPIHLALISASSSNLAPPPIPTVFEPLPICNASQNPALLKNPAISHPSKYIPAPAAPTCQETIADRSHRPHDLFRKRTIRISNDPFSQENSDNQDAASTDASNNISISLENSAKNNVQSEGAELTSTMIPDLLDSAYRCYQIGTRIMKLSAYSALSIGTIIFLGKRWMPNRYRFWLDTAQDRNLAAGQNGQRIKMNPLSIMNDMKRMGTQAMKAFFNYAHFQVRTNPDLKQVGEKIATAAPVQVITQMIPKPSTRIETDWGSRSEIFFSPSSRELPVLSFANAPSETPSPAALEIGAHSLSQFLSQVPLRDSPESDPHNPASLNKEESKEPDDSKKESSSPNVSEHSDSGSNPPFPAPILETPRLEEPHPTEDAGLEELDDPPEGEIPLPNPDENISSGGGWYEWAWGISSSNPQPQPQETTEPQIPSSNPSEAGSSSEKRWYQWR